MRQVETPYGSLWRIPDLVNIQKAILENEPVEIVDLPIENDPVEIVDLPIENDPVEIVDLPIDSMVIFQFVM